MKIDVQGFEGPALRGGQATLRKAAAVMIETSFVPLYRAQLLFADVLGQMDALGFSLFGNIAQYDDPRSERPLFADSLFINAKYTDRLLG